MQKGDVITSLGFRQMKFFFVSIAFAMAVTHVSAHEEHPHFPEQCLLNKDHADAEDLADAFAENIDNFCILTRLDGRAINDGQFNFRGGAQLQCQDSYDEGLMFISKNLQVALHVDFLTRDSEPGLFVVNECSLSRLK